MEFGIRVNGLMGRDYVFIVMVFHRTLQLLTNYDLKRGVCVGSYLGPGIGIRGLGVCS